MSRILVIVLVAFSAYYLVRRLLTVSGGGCSKGCGCNDRSKESKKKEGVIDAEFTSKF